MFAIRAYVTTYILCWRQEDMDNSARRNKKALDYHDAWLLRFPDIAFSLYTSLQFWLTVCFYVMAQARPFFFYFADVGQLPRQRRTSSRSGACSEFSIQKTPCHNGKGDDLQSKDDLNFQNVVSCTTATTKRTPQQLFTTSYSGIDNPTRRT